MLCSSFVCVGASSTSTTRSERIYKTQKRSDRSGSLTVMMINYFYLCPFKEVRHCPLYILWFHAGHRTISTAESVLLCAETRMTSYRQRCSLQTEPFSDQRPRRQDATVLILHNSRILISLFTWPFFHLAPHMVKIWLGSDKMTWFWSGSELRRRSCDSALERKKLVQWPPVWIRSRQTVSPSRSKSSI